MDLGPSLHLNTGTIVDICNFEGYLPRLIDILGNEYFGIETLIKLENVNSSSSVSGLSMVFCLLWPVTAKVRGREQTTKPQTILPTYFIRVKLSCWPGPSCSKLSSDNLGVSARFEFRFESLKSSSVLILFVYKLMIGSSKNNRENYPRKCFWTQERETRVKFNPGLSADRPSNNWAQFNEIRWKPYAGAPSSSVVKCSW